MKKIMVVCFIISSMLLACFGLNYYSNEKMIKNYNRGVYKVNSYDILGFLQPYVREYNRGNIDYKEGNYDKAIEDYQKALKKHPPKKKECKIRINLVLAMVAQLDFENVNSSNVDEYIDVLQQGIDILTEKGCANEDQVSGHDIDAQQLEIELAQMIEALKNPSGGEGDSDNQDQKDDQKNTEEAKEEPKEKSDLQKKFEEQQKEVQKGRNDMYEVNEIYKMEIDFSTDPVW